MKSKKIISILTACATLFTVGAPIVASANTNSTELPVTKKDTTSSPTSLPKIVYFENFEVGNDLFYGNLVNENGNTFARSETGNNGSDGEAQTLLFNMQNAHFVKGEKYVLSFDYKSIAPDKYNTIAVTINPYILTNTTPNNYVVTPSAEWQTKTLEFTAEETADSIGFNFDGSVSQPNTFDIDNISVIAE